MDIRLHTVINRKLISIFSLDVNGSLGEEGVIAIIWSLVFHRVGLFNICKCDGRTGALCWCFKNSPVFGRTMVTVL